jgi:hypothetical protein
VTTESKVIEEQHHVNLVLRVRVPDGLYIPLESPTTAEERESWGGEKESLIVGAEVSLYIREKLSAIGVEIEHLGIIETYTIQTTKV